MLSKLGSGFAPVLAYAGVLQGMGATQRPHTQELNVLIQSRENEDSLSR